MRKEKKDYYAPLLPERYYHCVNHAVGTELLFREPDNYRYFLDKYKKYIAPFTRTYAFCLMPNHFHFLIKIQTLDKLNNHFSHLYADLTNQTIPINHCENMAQQFSNFFNAYAKAYNKKFERRGALFERPFKRSFIKDNEHFLNTIRYIHQNPVHHGFTDNIETWEHTSYHAYVNPLIKGSYKNEVLDLFGGLNYFTAFHADYKIVESFE